MTNDMTLDDVRAAAQRLRGEVIDTPCLASRTLSALAGCEVFLKFENLQFTASFKERGALNKMAQLTAQERAAGVLAVSAGNQAWADLWSQCKKEAGLPPYRTMTNAEIKEGLALLRRKGR